MPTTDFVNKLFIENFLNSPATIFKGTWREWFKDVLWTLLLETEQFSGKRPNCNSGWGDELAAALANHIDPEVVESWEEEEGTSVPYRVNHLIYQKVCKDVLDYLFKGG